MFYEELLKEIEALQFNIRLICDSIIPDKKNQNRQRDPKSCRQSVKTYWDNVAGGYLYHFSEGDVLRMAYIPVMDVHKMLEETYKVSLNLNDLITEYYNIAKSVCSDPAYTDVFDQIRETHLRFSSVVCDKVLRCLCQQVLTIARNTTTRNVNTNKVRMENSLLDKYVTKHVSQCIEYEKKLRIIE